jgi:hypothetical protein
LLTCSSFAHFTCVEDAPEFFLKKTHSNLKIRKGSSALKNSGFFGFGKKKKTKRKKIKK